MHGGVEPPLVFAVGGAEAAGDLVAHGDGGDEGAPVGAGLLGDGPGGRNGDDVGMDRSALVDGVVVERGGMHAVDERGAAAAGPLAARPDCARARGAVRQDDGACGFAAGRVGSGPGHAQGIEHAPPGRPDHFLRKVVVACLGGECRETLGQGQALIRHSGCSRAVRSA